MFSKYNVCTVGSGLITLTLLKQKSNSKIITPQNSGIDPSK